MDDKTVYSYDAVTGEFNGEEIARVCPVTGTDYHYPAHTTEKKPPTKQTGKVAVFNGTSWTHIVDHRGKARYDEATREPLGVMHDLGELPPGQVFDLPPLPEAEAEPSELDVLKAALKEKGVLTDADITAARAVKKAR